jgi:glutathione reductase (NADPH)
MAGFVVDFFVRGGGAGGVRGARIAADPGARVAIAEESRWGGTCVVRGCVPKKLMVYASEVRRSLDDARGQGWTIPEASFDWSAFIAAKDVEIARLSAAYLTRLQKAGVRIFEGRATVVDPHTVSINGARVTAANILVATGGRPRMPPEAAADRARWISSDQAFHLPSLPRRIAILGAGYIGIEFAHIFAGFGSSVTLVHRNEHVLSGFADPEAADHVQRNFAQAGITLRHGNHVEGDFDLYMSAIGRQPMSSDLGLESASVVTDGRGAIVVDEWSRTNVPHIYAVGDVTQRMQLTPVAIREAHAVADNLFAGKAISINHELIPTAVFAQPPLAQVGLTEPAARELGHDVTIYRATFKPMRYALSGRDEKVFIKLVVEKASDIVLGVHMVGPDAPEIIQSVAIAVTMGAKKADFDRTYALHPTTAEELVLMR